MIGSKKRSWYSPRNDLRADPRHMMSVWRVYARTEATVSANRSTLAIT